MKAVILAAGRSSRFKPLSDKRHKALTEVMGKPIIQHTIDELRETDVEEVIVVQGNDRDIENAGVSADKFVVQEQPEGMGNALLQAEEHLENKFLVLTPYRSNAEKIFQPLIDKAVEEESDIVFVASKTDKPEKYGILDVQNDKAVDIVEKPEPENAPSNLKAVGMYLLSDSFLKQLKKVETKEYQYEEALSIQMEDSPAYYVKTDKSPNSIKYPWDLFNVMSELLNRKEREISETAEIAESAEINGKVIIEDDVAVHENAVIKGPAYIGEGTVIGNNALVRNGSCIERNSTVGANCEVKNSSFQPHSSMHSSFIGDSVLGRNSSIGAGTVIANKKFRDEEGRPEISCSLIGKDYRKKTGRNSLGCFIGEDVDVGINCSIMPGIQIGSDSKIGPRAIVEENIDNNDILIVDQDKRRG